MKIVMALMLVLLSFAAKAEQCLIPNTGYTPVSCKVIENGGGANWVSKKIAMGKQTLFTLDQSNGSILYDDKHRQISTNSRLIQANSFWVDGLKKETEDDSKAAWTCYVQTNGTLSVCIPFEG